MLASLPSVSLGQEAEKPVFLITGVDLANLPLVNVTVSGSNLGAPLAELPALLKEDKVEQPILESKPLDVGIAAGFLVDASNNIRDRGNTGDPRYVEIANAVDRFIQMKMLAAETDWLAAYTIDAGGAGFQQLADWTQDHQAVANQLRLYQPEQMPETTPLFNLIKYGLDQIEIGPFPPNLRRNLVVFSDGYDSLSAVQIDDIVSRANRLGVTIHTVMIGPEAEDRRQNLQRIADVTDGEYVLYSSLADMEQLWTKLAAERQQQQYTYRLTKAQPELLELSVTAPNQRTFSDEYPYPFVPAQPAQITIAQPTAGAVVSRTGAEPDTPQAELAPTTLAISLDVQWPDGHPRNFDRMEYEIGGKTLVQATEPFTYYEFPLAEFDAGAQTLRVLATDELGIESKSAPQSFQIEFILPTPAPAATVDNVDTSAGAGGDSGANPDATAATPAANAAQPAAEQTEVADAPVPTTAVVPLTTPVAAGWVAGPSWRFGGTEIAYGTTAAGERQLRFGSTAVPVNLATISLAAAPFVILIGALALAGRRRRASVIALPSAYEPATSADNKSTMIEATAYELTEDATEAQPIVDFESPAWLVYVEGGEHLPKKLNIEGGREIRIGRKAAYCDILIDDQRVSRLHASIHEREDGNFYLKDEGSSGGTFVNRRKLRVNDSHLMSHGDIINFNTVAYRFELADGGEGHGSGNGANNAAGTSGGSANSQ
ncbi:MAG: FHA domain-containing protein [Caldilineaceae bacterium]